MDNASLILLTLDSHLRSPTRLILYGRAALQLGFTGPPPAVAQSKDVDAIIPLGDLDALSADDGFWDAQEATNSEQRTANSVPRGSMSLTFSVPTKFSSVAIGSGIFFQSSVRLRAG
ncbi:MAG: hypothetical protein ACI8XO_004212 [Verrucomicrobiales bacterium]|jgi:hypothetical protein